MLVDVDRKSPRVLEFTTLGVLVGTHCFEKLRTAGQSSKCRFLDVHGDTLIVADLGECSSSYAVAFELQC